ncbi:MAG: hypothetical protein ACT6SC_19095, partial [Blastomonas fulva]
ADTGCTASTHTAQIASNRAARVEINELQRLVVWCIAACVTGEKGMPVMAAWWPAKDEHGMKLHMIG